MNRTYTVKQVAQMLQVGRGQVYDLIYMGKIKAIRLSERCIRISESALQEFIKNAEQDTCHISLLEEAI